FGCIILTENHNHMGSAIPYDTTYIIKETIIEDNVWLGINVILLPGITIGERAIIQAGSVVVCDIPPLAIAGGHPAKVFSWRDKEHYYKLKNEKSFH
ncbi:acyltransferase, partial [Klebsiella pneumoniae]